MGKHTRPKTNYRAALLVGAAPIAMLLASPGVSSAAETIELGGLKVTPDFERGHTVTEDNGTTTYKDFLAGYADAMNTNGDSMPLGEEGEASYSSTQTAQSGGEFGLERTESQDGSTSYSPYAQGRMAGTNDLAGGFTYGDYGFSSSDASSADSDFDLGSTSFNGPEGTGTTGGGSANGSMTHAGSTASDLGDGRSVTTENNQSMTGSVDSESTGAVDQETGTATFGGATSGETAGTNTLGGAMDLGDGNQGAVTGTQSMAGAFDSEQATTADKDGNVSSTNAANSAMGGTNDLTAGGDFGPGHSVLNSTQSGTISGVLDSNASREAGGASAASNSGTISGVFDNQNSGAFGIDNVLDASVDSHQKGDMGGTLSSAGSLDEQSPAESSASLTNTRDMSFSDETGGKLGVLDLVNVSGGAGTDVQQSGSEALSTEGASTPEENGNLAHTSKLDVQVGDMEPMGGELDFSLSPFKLDPKLHGGPLGEVGLDDLNPANLGK